MRFLVLADPARPNGRGRSKADATRERRLPGEARRPHDVVTARRRLGTAR